MKIFRNYVGTMHILFGTMQEQCNSVCGTMLIRQLAALHLSRIKSGTKSIRSLRSQWLGQGRSLYKGDLPMGHVLAAVSGDALFALCSSGMLCSLLLRYALQSAFHIRGPPKNPCRPPTHPYLDGTG